MSQNINIHTQQLVFELRIWSTTKMSELYYNSIWYHRDSSAALIKITTRHSPTNVNPANASLRWTRLAGTSTWSRLSPFRPVTPTSPIKSQIKLYEAGARKKSPRNIPARTRQLLDLKTKKLFLFFYCGLVDAPDVYYQAARCNNRTHSSFYFLRQ